MPFPSGLLVVAARGDEPAGQVLLHPLVLVGGGEAERGGPPHAPAAEPAVLDLLDPDERLARRAGRTVDVGGEALAQGLAERVAPRERVGHERRLEPRACRALVGAGPVHRLVSGVGILGEAVRPGLRAAHRADRGPVHVVERAQYAAPPPPLLTAPPPQ